MTNDKDAIEALLSFGVEDVIVREHLEKRMLAGEKLRVKFGIDPTSPHMHLGHTVPLRKLRQFQDLGHTAVLIIGDATAMIGDPTGRSEARKTLTREEIDANKETYITQAGKILDLDKTEIHHNGEWFFPMPATEFLGLTSLVTVQQVMQRDDFRKRLDDTEHPLKAIELTYPVMQGYDSVMVKADVEIGGADQLLNLHMGRRMQGKFGQPEQDILTVPFLVGTDGERKMSKSFGNAIALQDGANTMFAKVMTIPDSLIISYFTLLTSVPSDEIAAISRSLIKDEVNPRDVKARLGREIVASFHGNTPKEKEEIAWFAEDLFNTLTRDREIPTDIKDFSLPAGTKLADALVATELVASKSDARRQVEQGGVKVNDVVATDFQMELSNGDIIQKGKRFFARIVCP